jgi:hypothetical protein
MFEMHMMLFSYNNRAFTAEMQFQSSASGAVA